VFGGKPEKVKVTVCPAVMGFGDMVTFGLGRICGRKYPIAKPAPAPITAAAAVDALPILFFILLMILLWINCDGD
jgi:hypothetical protein